jgi:hypothetical protein
MSTLNTTNLKNPSSGSNNIILATDGSTTIPTLSATTITGTTIQGVIKSGTAVASTSGTFIDFTGIPSWVKRVTVMFSGVSTNGTSNPLIQIGSGGFSTTGYTGASIESSATKATFTTGFGILAGAAANTIYGHMAITLSGSNLWIASSNMILLQSSVGFPIAGAGSITLSGTLDRIRLTTVNGTDAFDAGSVNILYEG